MFPSFQLGSIPCAKREVLQAKWEAIWHERTVLQREVSLRRVFFLGSKKVGISNLEFDQKKMRLSPSPASHIGISLRSHHLTSLAPKTSMLSSKS